MDELQKDAALMIDGHMGIYVPQRFVMNYDMKHWHVKDADVEILVIGPTEQNIFYWDTWDDVLNYAWCEENGKVYNLWQDGDLWAYCPADQE